MLLTKSDLLSYLTEFSPERAEHYLRQLATEAPLATVTTRNSNGIDPWVDWLRKSLTALGERRVKGETLRPAVQPDGARLHHAEIRQDHTHHHHGRADRHG